MLLQKNVHLNKASEFNKIIEDLAYKTLDQKHLIAEDLVHGIICPNEITESKAYILHLSAKLAFDNNFIESSLDFINAAIDLIPCHAELYKTKGLIYFINNHYQEAEKQFRLSLEIQEENNESWLYLADILLSSNNYFEAYMAIKKLTSFNNKFNDYVDKIICKCLDNITPCNELPILDLYHDLIGYLYKENTSLSTIGELCFFTIKSITNKGDMDFNNNELLIKTLTSGIVTDTEIELTLLQTRKSLLLDSLIKMTIKPSNTAIIAGLAIHSYYNEYIYYIDHEEEQLIKELKKIIQNISFDQKNIPSLSAFIMLYCMYQPMTLLNIDDYLKARFKLLPAALQYLIQCSLFNRKKEQLLKQELTSLNAITDVISSKVQQQYEENPFPRWITVSYQIPQIDYHQTIPYSTKPVHIPSTADSQTLQLLVAGCGTGQHPIALAKMIKNTHITAIDISKSSIAYAKRMAEEYQADNIEFIHGDILDLTQLRRQFHIIECVGVLHHMQNPTTGLEILRSVLASNGIIKLGLYSSLARKDIIKLRSINAKIKMQATTENLRDFRYAILTGNIPDQIIFTQASDFYSTSSCRDLLFHEQEHYFTITQIERMLHNNGLKFIGFCTSPNTRDIYQKMFPSEPTMQNLHYWEVIEKHYPDTFISMYQFHCQAI